MADKTTLGDRMKAYENAYKYSLPPIMPVILRIDGKAFHTFTRGLNRPFDLALSNLMADTTEYLIKNIQGCRFGYTQSDEISLLLVYYANRDSQAWFANELQKMVSLSASLTTGYFNKYNLLNDKMANFDARAFVIPKFDVVNYFIWRQRDWQKNSIQMLARHYFSHKELVGKNGTEMVNMLEGVDVTYGALDNRWRLGIGVDNTVGVFDKLPEFTKDREFIEKYTKDFTDD